MLVLCPNPIGVALKGCDLAIVYTIVKVTLYHEIAQELADYLLLTKHAGLDPFRALALNFLILMIWLLEFYWLCHRVYIFTLLHANAYLE